MSMADLVATLKASLRDAATVFSAPGDVDFEGHLRTAADDFRRHKPRLMYGEITLQANQGAYALPADFGEFIQDTWGQQRKKPWETGFSGRLPRIVIAEVEGVKKLVMSPPPSQANIDDAGAALAYWYKVPHTIHATDGALTTIPPALRGLLILRAQAEAMRQIAFRNSRLPVTITEGMSSQPRNGSASYLYQALLADFEKAAAC